MKELGKFILGVVFVVLSVILLLSNISVGSIHFYSFGRISTAPILIVLFVIFLIVAIVNSKWYTWSLVGADIIFILLSVIFGTRLYFNHMSALQLLLILALFAVGVGIIIKTLIDVGKE